MKAKGILHIGTLNGWLLIAFYCDSKIDNNNCRLFNKNSKDFQEIKTKTLHDYVFIICYGEGREGGGGNMMINQE